MGEPVTFEAPDGGMEGSGEPAGGQQRLAKSASRSSSLLRHEEHEGGREGCFSCCTQCHFLVRVTSRKSLELLHPREPETRGLDARAFSRQTVIQAVAASNVPGMDVDGGADPFVRIELQRASDGKALCEARSWPHRTNTLMPIWGASRVLEGSFVEGTQLFVELIDFDDAITTRLFGEDIIGTSVVQWSEAIAAGKEIEAEVEYSAKVKTLPEEPCKVRLRVLTPPPAVSSEPDHSPFVRWVFLIRHGESAWNKAEKDWSFHKMLNRNHPLSKKGVEQAEEVAALMDTAVVQGERDVTQLAGDNGAARVAYARKKSALPTSDAYDALARVGRIYASPLTRATQTALVTMQHHPKLASHGLILCSHLREVKNWFGLDTTGTSRGHNIKQRVEKETSDILGPLKKSYSAKLCSPDIDFGDATDIWWNDVKETDTDVRHRMDEVLTMLKFDLCGFGAAETSAEPTSAMLVGHSLFFRHLCLLISSHLLSFIVSISPLLRHLLLCLSVYIPSLFHILYAC